MIPIVTHPERNVFLQEKPDEMARWIEEEAYIQVTAQSFLGVFGRRARDSAHELMKRGLVHFIASDAHDTENRPPRLDLAFEALSRRAGEQCAQTLAVYNPQAVLDGARQYLARGFRPSGTIRNAEAFRNRVDVRVDESEFTLMCDAQTSGGLLISVPPAKLPAIEQKFRQSGLFYATIGKVTERSGSITLIP